LASKFLTGIGGFMKTRNIILLLAVVLLLSSCSARRENSSESPDMTAAFTAAGVRLLNQTISARDFTLHLISASEGILEETVTLSELKGNVVFLKFWASWCGPCREGMPPMESLYNRFKDREFEMLAVNIREGEAAVTAFLEASNLSFPILHDSDGGLSAAYGVQALPTTFLINKEGKIIARFLGSLNWDSPQFHTALEMLLDT
jgi:thiol-disulfide isomerase/thioredoxin